MEPVNMSTTNLHLRGDNVNLSRSFYPVGKQEVSEEYGTVTIGAGHESSVIVFVKSESQALAIAEMFARLAGQFSQTTLRVSLPQQGAKDECGTCRHPIQWDGEHYAPARWVHVLCEDVVICACRDCGPRLRPVTP